MLRGLSVRGFKPFRRFSVEFSNFDILVGKNNMGKSTLIDALRLVASESNPRLRRDRTTVPLDSTLSEAETAFLVPTDRIPFPIANVHHEYGGEEASIEARFDRDIRLHVAFGPPPGNECLFAVSSGGAFLDNLDAIRRSLRQISIGVLPPIAPVEENEPLLAEDYVRRWFGTHRTPRHFRNLWHYDSGDFEEFRQLLKDTWPGADISLPESGVNMETGEVELNMFYREDRISREIAWAGHGMQVWLQILTYLAKFGNISTLVLDEPETSLHSDVQRKLVHILQEHASQIIVATHSVDIINEVPPERVVVIDKRQSTGRHLESIRQIQQVVEGLGSVQNIHLLSLLRSRFVLFLEGGDRKILAAFGNAMGMSAFPDPRAVSVVELEGEANWRRLKDFNWVLTNTLGEKVRSYVILDRDYRTESQVDDLVTTLRRSGVGVHVWARKEIENYLLSPAVINRCLEEGMSKRSFPSPVPSQAGISAALLEAAEGYKEPVRSKLLGQLIEEKRHSKEDPSTTVAQFNASFNEQWRDENYRLARVPGKDMISEMASWSQSTTGTSLTIASILRNLTQEDVEKEVAATIREIVKRSSE